jgi:hypothetical protein
VAARQRQLRLGTQSRCPSFVSVLGVGRTVTRRAVRAPDNHCGSAHTEGKVINPELGLLNDAADITSRTRVFVVLAAVGKLPPGSQPRVVLATGWEV